MAHANWLEFALPAWWKRRHRASVSPAQMELADGTKVPSILVGNVGSAEFWVQRVAVVQDGHVFLVTDERLPVRLPPDGPWLNVALTAEPPFDPDAPWVALVWEPDGREHRSN
jgi:hypothetical protein